MGSERVGVCALWGIPIAFITDMLAAKARLEAARKAHEAAKAELDALRAKKKAEGKLKEALASQAAADEAEVHDRR